MNFKTRLNKLNDEFEKWIEAAIEQELARFPDPRRSELIALAKAEQSRAAQLCAAFNTDTNDSLEFSQEEWNLILGAHLWVWELKHKKQEAVSQTPSLQSNLIEARFWRGQ